MKLLFNKNRNDQYDEEQVCMTVIARFGTGGGNTPLILEKTYQEKTGTLSPGAHAGSYNGQDAYNDMLVTEKRNELHASSVRSLQGIGTGISSETEGLQGCNGSDFERGGVY